MGVFFKVLQLVLFFLILCLSVFCYVGLLVGFLEFQVVLFSVFKQLKVSWVIILDDKGFIRDLLVFGEIVFKLFKICNCIGMLSKCIYFNICELSLFLFFFVGRVFIFLFIDYLIGVVYNVRFQSYKENINNIIFLKIYEVMRRKRIVWLEVRKYREKNFQCWGGGR